MIGFENYNYYKEINNIEILHINNSNASRCFYNFYTTKENYILMNQICQSLTKYNINITSLAIKDNLINKEIARYTVVEMILKIINYRSINENNLAIKTYNDLEKYYSKNLFDQKLMDNIKDQVKMAIVNNNYYQVDIDLCLI